MKAKIKIYNGTDFVDITPETLWDNVLNAPEEFPPEYHTHSEYLEVVTLSQSRNATTYTITNTGGANASLAGATTSLAGLMIATDKVRLDGMETGAQVNVGTNLSSSTVTGGRRISSSTGGNVDIPEATTTTNGWMSGADKVKLNGLSNYTHPPHTERSVDLAGATVISKLVSNAEGHITDLGTRNLTKANVGLGNVSNYSVASQIEAEQGTSTVRYMTPLRTTNLLNAAFVFDANTNTLDINL